jgi:hypothetical protein
MGAAVQTEELRRVVEKLARQYKLGIAQYFGELQAVLSPEFRAAVQKHNIELVTYRDLIAAEGLAKMQRPPEFQ